MMNLYKDTYFAADESDKMVGYLKMKGDEWFNIIYRNNYMDKIRRSWSAYHGNYYNTGHNITYGGEQGELVNLAVNHYRNLARWMLNMITANRPAFQARSANTDFKSQSQTYLANGLLDYYMREERLEKYLAKAAEYAIVLGSGFIKMTWNSTSGKIYDYIERQEEVESKDLNDEERANSAVGENNKYLKLKKYPIYEGNVEFVNLSPLDVVFDTSKETPEQRDWLLCRSFKNKYDLAAKYPELREKILGIPSKIQQDRRRIVMSMFDQTDDVPVYEFFHKRTESLPDGRYCLYLDVDVILEDSVMPYRDLPVYRISPADILGTPFGYTDMFDLLPLQDQINSSYSTIASNHNAFGVQNVLMPRGCDVIPSQISGGLNIIEYNAQVGKPEPMNLTHTPTEIFNFISSMEKNMETISGINSVVRGNPENSLKSGTALALVQANALQFMSNLQRSYVQLIEDIGTGLITLLQDFAATPRVIAIVGVNNQTKMKEFKGSDLDAINRVIVDSGNALASTPAGKIQMAEQMLQMFGDKLTPEQYFSVINTGKLEVMSDGINNELLLIRSENEKLVSGETQMIATAVESHQTHIKEHRNVLFDPDLKLDPELVKRVLDHIQEHIGLLQTTDPNLLSMLGQQPLSPPGGSPVSPENAASAPVPQEGQGINPGVMTPQEANAGNPKASLPGLPNPAQSPDGRPTMIGSDPASMGK